MYLSDPNSSRASQPSLPPYWILRLLSHDISPVSLHHLSIILMLSPSTVLLLSLSLSSFLWLYGMGCIIGVFQFLVALVAFLFSSKNKSVG